MPVETEMKRTTLLLLAVATIIVLGVALYRFRSADGLNVDPHAAKEIEKAKQR